MVQKALIIGRLTAHETHKRDYGYHTANEDLKTLKREDSKHVTLFGGNLTTFQRDSGTIPTPERENSFKAPTGGYKTPY